MTAQRVLVCFYWCAVAALLLPLGLLAATSVSDRAFVGFPLGTPTLRWYAVALADPAFGQAFALSAGIAAGSAALAVVAGSSIALAACAASGPMRIVLLGGALVPLVTPGLVHAIALRTSLPAIGLQPGVAAIVLGHAIHGTPFAALMVAARRSALPPDLLDAAHDLGASAGATFLGVVLPWLRPAMLGAAALAALSSFDDFVRSFFLGGYEATLPVLVFSRLRSGLTPELNAVSTLVLLAACLLGLAADLTAWGVRGRGRAR